MRNTLLAAIGLTLAAAALVHAAEPPKAAAAPGKAKARPEPAGAPAVSAKSRPAALDAKHRRTAARLLDGGAKYIISQRDKNGTWSARGGAGVPAITSMVLKALIQHPDYGPEHPAVAKALGVLLTYQRDDGGVYNPREGGGSYTSAVALMALAATRSPRHQNARRKLIAYLKGIQVVPGAESSDAGGVKKDDPTVGGVSYGKGPGRPDLSNVGMWMEALHDAGVPPDDPAMQRAVGFISRLQNHTETNKMAWAAKGSNDGGFVYKFPDGGGGRGSQRGMGTRSYGTMTYTGFKSLLYAGVDRRDPRVRAAYNWIRRYWTLDANPNMPGRESQAGLYYYYHVFAKALRAWGEPVVTDLKGQKHHWRHELIDALAKRARPDGSWVNKASSRWWEGNPVLATSYTLLALEEAVAGQ